MANNRLYIGNTKTNQYFFLGKSFGQGIYANQVIDIYKFFNTVNKEINLYDDLSSFVLFTEEDHHSIVFNHFFEKGIRISHEGS